LTRIFIDLLLEPASSGSRWTNEPAAGVRQQPKVWFVTLVRLGYVWDSSTNTNVPDLQIFGSTNVRVDDFTGRQIFVASQNQLITLAQRHRSHFRVRIQKPVVTYYLVSSVRPTVLDCKKVIHLLCNFLSCKQTWIHCYSVVTYHVVISSGFWIRTLEKDTLSRRIPPAH
jgi:hypothetical protein